MANLLTAEQRARFRGPSFRMSDFRREGTLIDSTTTYPDVEVTEDVLSWGTTTVRCYGWHPTEQRSQDNIYPDMSWRLLNDDGKYSQDSSNSVFEDVDPSLWLMRFRLWDDGQPAPAPPALLVELTMGVITVDAQLNEAIVRGVHVLQRYLHGEFTYPESGYDIDWNGNSNTVRP